ncbi:MAG: oligosaccharide flippase family protein [Paenalcaligenes sp.]
MSNGRRVTKNAIILLFVQMANVLLPFVLSPYLTRTIGKDLFGLIAFGFAIIQMSYVFIDYGFGLSAVYSVSKNIENKSEIKKIVSSVFFSKFYIFLVICIFLFLYPIFFTEYSNYKLYFYLLIFPIFFQSMLPIWLFQGLEKMKYITIFVVSGRLLFVFLVVTFVNGEEDFLWVVIFNGLSLCFSFLLSMYFLSKSGYMSFAYDFQHIKKTFSESTEYFWSRVAVMSYGAGASFFLGSFSGTVQVAIYSIAEQFYRGAISLINPLAQALYPYMAKTKDIVLYKKVFYLISILTVLGVVFGILVGDWLINILFGSGYDQSYKIYSIFMIALLFAIPATILGYPLLGAMGNSRAANRSVMAGGIVQVLGLMFLYLYGEISAATVVVTVIMAEIMVFSYRLFFARKILWNNR